MRRTKDNTGLCVHAEETLGWAYTFGGELDAVLPEDGGSAVASNLSLSLTSQGLYRKMVTLNNFELKQRQKNLRSPDPASSSKQGN